ncbi:DUF2167 domain-containing protein [Undibacterium sp. Jales W-56]|uniref:DUF2167 domain-containing protein n=1 Tax=Undibacterium sp. Jales W-56 TaxID=2897325 RepID=UPI0021D1C634|nr:DUF2167 domain-containing protein [Undibacterium sp. Jales W-56]MCU6434570.1 DUF2167 domain-containing protein [Undibacterium sp. Jales W-56]
MFKKLGVVVAIAVSLLFAQMGQAAAAADAPEKKMTAEEFVASLKFQQGKITLQNGIAHLNLSPSFRYLSPEDAEKVLVDAWGNPPGAKTLGMIFPANLSPLSAASWGVVVTYDEDGHVKDDDADSINYDDLLKEMKEANLASNEERKKAGYAPMTLVGWAEKPSYDKASHKFYWAKEFSGSKAGENSLNYNIRVLGRKGVLVLNAVAGMEQITEVKKEMQNVVAFTEFVDGNRYADFDAKSDKVAEYGLAALVAGGVAAKLGFFGKIFAMLLAFKKILLVGLAAAGTALAKLFGKKKDGDTA